MSSSVVSRNHPPIAVVITVILLLFFFFGILCVYFCRCFLATLMTNWHFRRNPNTGAAIVAPTNPNNNNPPPPSTTFGLHPDKIQALPSFKYSDVKDFRRHNYGFECAICLTEFRDDHLLRLLTTCCHLFHQDCIDLWFHSHSTCPVCRSDLDDLPAADDDQDTLMTPMMILNNRSSCRPHNFQDGSLYHHMINMNVDDDDGINNHDDGRERCCRLDNKEENNIGMVKFSRSNTTGHSLVSSSSSSSRKEEDDQVGGDEKDKYTLRLRDNVKINIIRRHNYAVSCITFGDF